MISFFRLIIIIITVVFLFTDIQILKIASIFLIIIAIFMDNLDGYIARKFKVCTKFGSVLDIMVDRLAENMFWISFAILGLIPAWAPIIVIIRTASTDALRSMALSKGKSTFGMMGSKFGRMMVSSRISRGLYGLSKLVCFTLAAIVHAYGMSWLSDVLFYAVIFTVGFAVLRGIMVIYDSRSFILDTK